MDDQIVIRLYQPGDEEKLLALHNKVMKTPWSMEFWRWLYLDNPAGKAVVVVAEDQGRIVGHFAYFPVRMQWHGKPFTGSKSVQAMVDPDYQGRGLFTEITKELLRHAQINDVALTYSCPNDISYVPLVYKVGYRNISQGPNSDNSKSKPHGVPLLVRPLVPSALVSALVKHPVLKWLTHPLAKTADHFFRQDWPSSKSLIVKEISTFDEQFDALWQNAVKDYSLCTIRDRQYLNWRYIQNPEKKYLFLAAREEEKLRGYIIAGMDEFLGLKAGFIVDMLALNQDQATCNALLSETLHSFKQMGAEVAVSAMLPHHFYYKSLREVGFIPMPQRLSPKKFYMVVHDNKQGIPSDALHDHRHWFVTFGDWDVF